MHIAASTDVRLAYKEFLGAVVELCNGEVLSEEFQEVAKTSYDLLTGHEADSDGIRGFIETKYVLMDIFQFSLVYVFSAVGFVEGSSGSTI